MMWRDIVCQRLGYRPFSHRLTQKHVLVVRHERPQPVQFCATADQIVDLVATTFLHRKRQIGARCNFQSTRSQDFRGY